MGKRGYSLWTILAATISVAEAGPLEVNAIERGQYTIANKPKRPVLTRNDQNRMANVTIDASLLAPNPKPAATLSVASPVVTPKPKPVAQPCSNLLSENKAESLVVLCLSAAGELDSEGERHFDAFTHLAEIVRGTVIVPDGTAAYSTITQMLSAADLGDTRIKEIKPACEDCGNYAVLISRPFK